MPLTGRRRHNGPGYLKGEPGSLVGHGSRSGAGHVPQSFLVGPLVALAARGAAHQPVVRALPRGRGRDRAVHRHARRRPGRLPRRLRAAGLGDQRQRGRGAADPDHHRRRHHHRGRRGVLHHPGHPDPGLDPVRAADAAQLHPRPGHAADAGHVRGHVRLRGAGTGLDRDRVARRLRAAHQRDRDARPDGHRPGRAHLLHPPHGGLHPAAAGDREHRGRPGRGDPGAGQRAGPDRDRRPARPRSSC